MVVPSGDTGVSLGLGGVKGSVRHSVCSFEWSGECRIEKGHPTEATDQNCTFTPTHDDDDIRSAEFGLQN